MLQKELNQNSIGISISNQTYLVHICPYYIDADEQFGNTFRIYRNRRDFSCTDLFHVWSKDLYQILHYVCNWKVDYVGDDEAAYKESVYEWIQPKKNTKVKGKFLTEFRPSCFFNDV